MLINRSELITPTLFPSEELKPLVNPAVTRPIHYLGSKLRIIDLIINALDRVDPTRGTVIDLFAGSGTVSRALSEVRDVIAVDIQEYSRVICSALLQPANCGEESFAQFMQAVLFSEHAEILKLSVDPLIGYEAECQRLAAKGNLEPLCDLIEHGAIIAAEHGVSKAKNPDLVSALNETHSRFQKFGLINAPRAIITRYFGGVYFSYAQASLIDMLLDALSSVPPAQNKTFLAAILSTASEVVNTIGKQFAQPIRPRLSNGKPKSNLYAKVMSDRSTNVIEVYKKWMLRYNAIPNTGRPHKIICSDYEVALQSINDKVSVIYADPPYTRDHYSRFYHVLETISLRDNPVISTVRSKGEDLISRGLYRAERHQSPFCIKSQAPEAFCKLFAGVLRFGVPFILSYSPYIEGSGARRRVMMLADIEKLAQKYFKRIEVLPIGNIVHNKIGKSKKNMDKSNNSEVFLICEPT